MNDETREALKVLMIATAGAVFGLIIALLVPITRGKHGDPGIYYPVNMAISMASVFLLVALLHTYIRDYREIHARFTLGLIIFLVTLLFQNIFSLPVIHSLFGFSAASLGPFSVIMNLLEVVAIGIFLYLSNNG